MLKFSAIIITGFLASTCIAQKSLKEYKALTDSAIRSCFSDAVFKSLLTDGYFCQEADNGQLLVGKYPEDSNKVFNVSTIEIFYEFTSKELNYKFWFMVGVDSISNIILNGAGFDDVPICVRRGKPCNYISKGKAMAISRKDSIRYPENLLVELRRLKNSNEYYWVVSGQKKIDSDENTEPEDRSGNYVKLKANTRYIHAKTGKILSYEEFNSPCQ